MPEQIFANNQPEADAAAVPITDTPQEHTNDTQTADALWVDAVVVARLRKRLRRLCAGWLVGPLAIYGLLGVTGVVGTGFSLLAIIYAYLVIIYAMAMRDYRLIAAVGKRHDLEAMSAGALTELIACGHPGAKFAKVAGALKRRLDGLSPNEAKLFTSRQRAMLRNLLAIRGVYYREVWNFVLKRPDVYYELQSSVLEVMVKIGETEDLKAMQRVATESPYAGIRTQATRCADELSARLTQESHTRLLLRPSQSPGDNSALLRPASTCNTDQSQLLKPIDD